MSVFYYFLLLLLLTSCFVRQEDSPRFDLEKHRSKFEYDRFNTIDFDSIKFDYKKEPMDSATYVAIFQKVFDRNVYDGNPCYFYSIQTETPNYSSIAIFQYHEAQYIEMILVNHDRSGVYVDKKTIALWGGHAGWEMSMHSTYTDDETIESMYVETDWEDTNEEMDLLTYFEGREVFKILKDGSIATISKDSVKTQEKRPW